MMEKGSCLHVMTQSKRMGKGEGLKEDWIAYILKETLQGQTLTLNVLQQFRTIISYLHGHTHVCPFCYGGTGRDWGVGRKESGGRDWKHVKSHIIIKGGLVAMGGPKWVYKGIEKRSRMLPETHM
jgi:hypothetical protein